MVSIIMTLIICITVLGGIGMVQKWGLPTFESTKHRTYCDSTIKPFESTCTTGFIQPVQPEQTEADKAKAEKEAMFRDMASMVNTVLSGGVNLE